MITVSGEVVIKQPASQVFGFLADLSNLPKWQTGAVESHVLTDGPIRLGTEFEEQLQVMGRKFTALCEIIEFSDGTHIGWWGKSTPQMMEYSGSFSIRPQGGESVLRYNGTTKLSGFWRLLEPLIKGEMKRETAKEMDNLKRALDG